MALLDIVSELSDRQLFKTETGDERIFGVVIGIVTENYHQDMPGRVRVRLPVRDNEANVLRWAKVARPYSGKEWSHYFMPEKEDQVLVAFEHGSIEMPYVIAAVPRDQDKIISGAADQENQFKKIVTRHGSSLIFEDHQEGDGDKDKISILTANGSHKVILDNENNKIMIADKEKKCLLEMLTEDGNIQIKAAKKLTLQVGDNIKLSCNGDNGTIQIDADKIQIGASRSLVLKTDGTAKLTGQQTVIEAAANLKQSSSGMLSLAGSPVKIG